MSKILFGTLIAWLVTSCNIEEPDSSGTLTVNPDYDIEIPEWLSIHDVDHNRDGIIDVLDLVLVSKFFGQEVTVDKSSDTISDSYKTSELPEFIYARVELEQIGSFGRETRKTVVIPEYGHNLQIAMRIQVQKKVTGDPFKDRFNFYDFPKIKIKIISNQQKPTQKEFTFNNRPSSIGGDTNTTEKYFNEIMSDLEGWADRGGCGVERWSQSDTVRNSYFGPDFFFQVMYFDLLVSNIREIKQLEDCPALGGYEGFHIGKEIVNKYTDTQINWIRLDIELDAADQIENRNYIRYVFRRFGENHPSKNMGTLLGQFMTPSIQQQIKEEHFPEDVN